MGHDVHVCIEDYSYTSLGHYMWLYATCTDQCAVKGASKENHSYEYSSCTESCQRNSFHLHNVCPCIRVWKSDLNAAQISSYKGSLMKSLPLLRDRMRGYMHWMAYCWHDLTLVNGLHESWCYMSHHLHQILLCWHQHLPPTMSVLHHGDPPDSPHTMELCCPGREKERNKWNIHLSYNHFHVHVHV